MDQSKGSTANTEADASKDTSKHNPFSNILKSGEADKLGSKSQGKVLYDIASSLYRWLINAFNLFLLLSQPFK
ncbi:hypothetical protein AB4428_11780 [Vibrio lentus]